MASYLCVTIRFLHPVFHGRGQNDEPEWPPSPLRIFQSLVAASSWLQPLSEDRKRAFECLESIQQAPLLIAPPAVVGNGYRLSIPNNSMDKVAAAWSRGNYFGSGDASPSGHRTFKRVRPIYLPEDAAIHCVWSLTGLNCPDRLALLIGELKTAARQLICLGWGMDMAIGEARQINDEELNKLSGERWLPARMDTPVGLRVPIAGTMDALQRHHRQFLDRMGSDSLRPLEHLTKFRRVEYRRASDPAPRPVVCFTLQRLEGGYRAFEPPRNTVRVAGMLRHAVGEARNQVADGPPLRSFIQGHGEEPGEKRHRSVNNSRFAYLPMPSIQFRGAGRSPVVGSIRRVCLTVFEQGHEDKIRWAQQMLPGCELVQRESGQESGEIVAILAPAAQKDWVLRRYLDPASDWATVSPVVLPGYDDPAHYRRRLAKENLSAQKQRQLLEALYARTDKLLRKAILQAGFSRELAEHADLDWRAVGFWPGTAKAEDYFVPDHLRRYPRLHVRLRWRDANGQAICVPGPICLGGGRFFGLGLFAALDVRD